MYGKYENTDRLWLTRHSNPYSASSLRYVLDAVFEFLANDWNHTDPTESCNDPQLVNVRKGGGAEVFTRKEVGRV